MSENQTNKGPGEHVLDLSRRVDRVEETQKAHENRLTVLELVGQMPVTVDANDLRKEGVDVEWLEPGAEADAETMAKVWFKRCQQLQADAERERLMKELAVMQAEQDLAEHRKTTAELVDMTGEALQKTDWGDAEARDLRTLENCILRLKKKLNVFKNQRDAARENRNEWARRYEGAKKQRDEAEHERDGALARLDEAEHQRDCALARREEAEHERDNANDQLAKVREESVSLTEFDSMANRMFEKVREEYRAAVEKYPSPNPNLHALFAEVGELSEAFTKKKGSQAVEDEAKQVMAVALRVWWEGDPAHDWYPEMPF